LWTSHCPSRWRRCCTLAAGGLPLPIEAKSSCCRQHRVNTVGICADEPPFPASCWVIVWDQLPGLIDFQPAMRGERECEFVGVGLFVAGG
jgi:hypothetical protein